MPAVIVVMVVLVLTFVVVGLLFDGVVDELDELLLAIGLRLHGPLAEHGLALLDHHLEGKLTAGVFETSAVRNAISASIR